MDERDWKTKGMDELLEDLRRRQRNIVFPDTVRNEGHFFRSLGSGNYDRRSFLRPIALIFGLLMICQYLDAALMFLPSRLVVAIFEIFGIGLLGIAVAVKIIFNAAFDRPAPPLPEFVTRRKKLSGRK